MADASVHLLRHYSGESHVNVGAGYDVTVAEFAEHVKRCVGFAGRIVYDRSRADGTPRKLLDISRLQQLGWQLRCSLRQGIELTYQWYLEQDNSSWRLLTNDVPLTHRHSLRHADETKTFNYYE